MKKLALAALAFGLSMGTAHAADLIIASDPMVDVAAAAHDWNGFYAGVFGGYGSGNTNYTVIAAPATQANIATSGWLLGATAGVNGQWDMFVLGVEGDIAWSNIGGDAAALGGTISTNTSWIATLRGRAGIAVDQALLYVTAGVAAANVSSTSNVPGTFAGTRTGWTAGAGLEYAVTEDWSVKAEYAYTHLGTASDGGALAGGIPANALDITPSFHAVKIGANFHF